MKLLAMFQYLLNNTNSTSLGLGERSESKSALDLTLIINHKEAIESIVESISEIGFNRYTFQNLHALLANNLFQDTEAPGRLRSFPVGISRSVYIPLGLSQLIEENFDLLLQKAGEIENPFEQSFLTMVQLPYMQGSVNQGGGPKALSLSPNLM